MQRLGLNVMTTFNRRFSRKDNNTSTKNNKVGNLKVGADLFGD